MDHKLEREKDVSTILNSPHLRKVVVAGPGTGKSFLFQEAIKQEQKLGKKKFLAITFIGKLGDALADDLAGLAQTMTLHGFARQFVLDKLPGDWAYYPKMADLVKEDLDFKGIKKFKIGDANYEERTKYYKAIGHNDVVHYAVQICKRDPSKIPQHDLILIDEFQDFDETESELIDILASKNKVLIVGDDDQALYEFKGSSPKFIRAKFDSSNADFESHTLRFCSRCTEVIIEAFHNIVGYFGLDKAGKGRIQKDYICYLPGKKGDSDQNPKIIVFEDVKPPLIPTKIIDELGNLLESQKIKEVLVIGEGRSCRALLDMVGKKLTNSGFRNVNHSSNQDETFSFKQNVIEGYKILAKGKNPIFAWRLLLHEAKKSILKKIVLDSYQTPNKFIESIPAKFKAPHERNFKVLNKILTGPKSTTDSIAQSTLDKLQKEITITKKPDREVMVNQLVSENRNLPRPLANLDITVCNILGSKGLGADVVFLIGFDQGKLPAKDKPEDSEIYQMLVALTRAKKRIYLINTLGSKISGFLDAVNPNLYTIIN